MSTYGSSLPEDLCHSIANVPTIFDIIPVSIEDMNSNQVAPALESFPNIPEALLAEVRPERPHNRVTDLTRLIQARSRVGKDP
jgi:hypothetical protein